MKKIAVTEANGYLASLVMKTNKDKFEFIPLTRKDISMDDPEAVKKYFEALDLVKNDFSKDNINKIEMRINDIKFRLGTDKFSVIENEYKFRKAEEEAQREQQNNEIQ